MVVHEHFPRGAKPTIHGGERAYSPQSWIRHLAGALRLMAQHIENNGVSKVVTAVAIIVIAAIILGAGSAGIVATYTTGKLEQRMTSGFCHLNQRLDEIQRPNQAPRTCDE